MMKQKIRRRFCFKGQKYNATGWVQNEFDGSVTSEVQGDEISVDMILQALFNDRYIRIDDMETKALPLEKNERGFAMRN